MAGFVEPYELKYFKEEMDLLPDPGSRLSEYHGWISRVESVTPTNDGGWRARFSGTVGLREGKLWFVATVSDPPEDVDVIPVRRIEEAAERIAVDDDRLTRLLEEAAETGEAQGGTEVEETDSYLNLFALLSDDFSITGSGHGIGDRLYFDVDGTTVELYVLSNSGDYGWQAWYYVDEHVVWRSGERDIKPRDGELLECRRSD